MNARTPMGTGIDGVVVFVDGHELYQSWLNLFGKRELDIEFIRNVVLTRIGSIKLGRYFIHLGVPGAPKFDEFLESIGLPAVRTVNIDVHTSLVAEAMEVLFQLDFETFVLVAGGNDYIPLVKKLKLHGKRVVVLFFSEATGRWLKSQCDEFLDLGEELLRIERTERPASGVDEPIG
ncbi:NYN domain-containing protein [Candidatus Bathyarchaeota archaeon]|nr:NYN domain-containing protein [Candidatus Bathyarchaeota archaeon]